MFADRKQAGNMLAFILAFKKIHADFVFAITRGGVVVGAEVSKTLNIPLIPFIIKKVSLPTHPELALGAVTFNRVYTLDQSILRQFNLTKKDIQNLIDMKYIQLQLLKKNLMLKRLPKLTNKTVIVVDDGIATGQTVKAGHKFLKSKKVAKIILATPVISKQTLIELKKLFFQIIALKIPQSFNAVGEFYKSFSQVEESDVRYILKGN